MMITMMVLVVVVVWLVVVDLVDLVWEGELGGDDVDSHYQTVMVTMITVVLAMRMSMRMKLKMMTMQLDNVIPELLMVCQTEPIEGIHLVFPGISHHLGIHTCDTFQLYFYSYFCLTGCICICIRTFVSSAAFVFVFILYCHKLHLYLHSYLHGSSRICIYICICVSPSSCMCGCMLLTWAQAAVSYRQGYLYHNNDDSKFLKLVLI